MKNKKITSKITQGMYVLTTIGGGCIVDAVSQISSGDYPLITVAVMKTNYTNELLKKNQMFALSVLGTDVSSDIITTFGMHSMRDVNKFESVITLECDGIKVIKNSLGYMICEITDYIDNDTHTLFIGKLVKSDLFSDLEAMSYNDYQKRKNDFIKVTVEKEKTAWICTVCGYVYYGDTLPENFTCPKCSVSKEFFEKQEK